MRKIFSLMIFMLMSLPMLLTDSMADAQNMGSESYWNLADNENHTYYAQRCDSCYSFIGGQTEEELLHNIKVHMYMEHSQNLDHGNGITYNPDESSSEGGSGNGNSNGDSYSVIYPPVVDLYEVETALYRIGYGGLRYDLWYDNDIYRINNHTTFVSLINFRMTESSNNHTLQEALTNNIPFIFFSKGTVITISGHTYQKYNVFTSRDINELNYLNYEYIFYFDPIIYF